MIISININTRQNIDLGNSIRLHTVNRFCNEVFFYMPVVLINFTPLEIENINIKRNALYILPNAIKGEDLANLKYLHNFTYEKFEELDRIIKFYSKKAKDFDEKYNNIIHLTNHINNDIFDENMKVYKVLAIEEVIRVNHAIRNYPSKLLYYANMIRNDNIAFYITEIYKYLIDIIDYKTLQTIF